MRPEELDPQFLAAETLKISILRLINSYETPCDIHQDDWQFDIYSLVIVLGRQNTDQSRHAILDLLDYLLPDSVHDAITLIVDEQRSLMMPLMQKRIGQPLSSQATRKEPYVEVMPTKDRDRGFLEWDA